MPSKLHGALVFCTKLCIKLAVFLCSFSQFSFPFNFQTANALVLKFDTLPLRCLRFLRLFSNTLLAIFNLFIFIFLIFQFKSYSRFCTEKWAKMTCGRVFEHKFISEANLKKSRGRFFHSQILLAEETKRLPLARPVFNLKAIEFGSFSPIFTFIGTVK